MEAPSSKRLKTSEANNTCIDGSGPNLSGETTDVNSRGLDLDSSDVRNERTAKQTRFVAVFAEKGGTGKTTTAFYLAKSLRSSGNKVLVVDADAQANVLQKFLTPSVADVTRGVTFNQFAFGTGFDENEIIALDGIHIIRGPHRNELDEDGYEARRANAVEDLYKAFSDPSEMRDQIITYCWKRIAGRCVDAEYDWVLFDMNPGRKDPVNQLLLIKADYIVSPLGVDNHCIDSVIRLKEHLERLMNDHSDVYKEERCNGAKKPVVFLYVTKVKTRNGRPQTFYNYFINALRRLCREAESADYCYAGFFPMIERSSMCQSLESMLERAQEPMRRKIQLALESIMALVDLLEHGHVRDDPAMIEADALVEVTFVRRNRRFRDTSELEAMRKDVERGIRVARGDARSDDGCLYVLEFDNESSRKWKIGISNADVITRLTQTAGGNGIGHVTILWFRESAVSSAIERIMKVCLNRFKLTQGGPGSTEWFEKNRYTNDAFTYFVGFGHDQGRNQLYDNEASLKVIMGMPIEQVTHNEFHDDHNEDPTIVEAPADNL
uniref:AAA domain-containing protein n=1 Tax=Pinguiococcus pyrenoidosus TaxID=172671 RepID=A0A7R9U655_9STRA|mmetsp:Transcript_15466/g.58820  ORF Transcript_15466/g.58820 Transcript_15466/m.58820 type:complete len:551 (+) Transcript_15466:110-1762(+)